MAVALLFTLSGCKSNKGKSPNGVASNDPLMGNTRIPPTSVPLPERGTGVGSRGGRNDPLLGSPTGNVKDPKKDSKTGAVRTEDQDRWKGPYIPSQGTTTAALTAKLRNDHSDLSIDERPADVERGARLQLTGGAIPTAASGQNLDQVPVVLQEDLAKFGVKRGDYEIVKTSAAEFAVRAQVPNKSNGVTRYEEVGPTAAAAVQRLLDQLKIDRP